MKEKWGKKIDSIYILPGYLGTQVGGRQTEQKDGQTKLQDKQRRVDQMRGERVIQNKKLFQTDLTGEKGEKTKFPFVNPMLVFQKDSSLPLCL